jgi:hypothetical protein
MLLFFALKSDLLLVLNEMEAKQPLKYVLAGMFSAPDMEQWTKGCELPELGQADRAQTAGCRTFVVTYPEVEVKLWRRQIHNGQIRFGIDQLVNHDTITFTPAGAWKGEMIIAGACGTVSDSPIAQSLMKLVSKAMKKHFVRIGAYWVGPEALSYLRAGGRLTGAEQSPPIYDLRESALKAGEKSVN